MATIYKVLGGVQGSLDTSLMDSNMTHNSKDGGIARAGPEFVF